MFLWATTRSGAYRVLLKIVWCVYSTSGCFWLKVESPGLRAPAWEQFCHDLKTSWSIFPMSILCLKKDTCEHLLNLDSWEENWKTVNYCENQRHIFCYTSGENEFCLLLCRSRCTSGCPPESKLNVRKKWRKWSTMFWFCHKIRIDFDSKPS